MHSSNSAASLNIEKKGLSCSGIVKFFRLKHTRTFISMGSRTKTAIDARLLARSLTHLPLTHSLTHSLSLPLPLPVPLPPSHMHPQRHALSERKEAKQMLQNGTEVEYCFRTIIAKSGSFSKCATTDSSQSDLGNRSF